MSYGLQVWDAAGNIELSITDRLTRLLYSTQVASGVDGSVTLPALEGHLSLEFSIAISEEITWGAHIVSRSGNIISWTHATNPNYTNYNYSTDSLIFVFLYT